MRARTVSIIFCVFALVFAASAQSRRGGSSLDRVLPHIRQTVPGTFYDAEGPFLSPDGQASYRIKWMTPDGRIIWFAVDARSGQIMGGPPSRYRPEEDNRGWPRGRDDDARYGDRGWDRGRRDQDGRGPGAGDNGRYDRGPERSNGQAPERGQSERGQSERGRAGGHERPHTGR